MPIGINTVTWRYSGCHIDPKIEIWSLIDQLSKVKSVLSGHSKKNKGLKAMW